MSITSLTISSALSFEVMHDKIVCVACDQVPLPKAMYQRAFSKASEFLLSHLFPKPIHKNRCKKIPLIKKSQGKAIEVIDRKVSYLSPITETVAFAFAPKVTREISIKSISKRIRAFCFLSCMVLRVRKPMESPSKAPSFKRR